MTSLGRIRAMLLGLFIADTILAAFVPVWILALKVAAVAGGMNERITIGLLAAGPMAALWWSVVHAVRGFRAAQTRRL